MKHENEEKRMSWGLTSSRIYHQRKIKFIHCIIICSSGFMFDECNGLQLQLQAKKCIWTRRWLHNKQVGVFWYASMYYITVDRGGITGISWLHQIRRIIGGLLDDVQALSVSVTDSNKNMNSYFHISDQADIGWINFLCGRWSVKWKEAQKRYYLWMNKKKFACL